MSGNGRKCLSRSIAVMATALVVCGQNFAAADGLTAVKLDDHAKHMQSVAISPDGSRVASVGDEGLIRFPWGGQATQGVLRVWETASHKPLVTQLNDHQLFAVTFLPHGARLAVGGNGLQIVQARDGKVLRTFEGVKGPVKAIAVLRDGSTLVSAGQNVVQFWNVNSGEQRKTGYHDAEITKAIRLTRDGRLLFAGGYLNDTKAERKYYVRLWDVGHEARDLRIGYSVPTSYRDAAFIADERRVVTVGPSGTIEEWDVHSGNRVREWETPRGVSCMAVTRNARLLATGDYEGRMTLWDVAAARPVGSCELPNLSCTSIAISDDARQIVVGTFKGEVWLVSRSTSAEPSDRIPNAPFQINARTR